MEDQQPRGPKIRRNPDGRDPNFIRRLGLIWVLLALVAGGWLARMWQNQQEHVSEIKYGQFCELVKSKAIKQVTIEAASGELSKIRGEYEDETSKKKIKFVAKVWYGDEIQKYLDANNIQIEFAQATQTDMRHRANAALALNGLDHDRSRFRTDDGFEGLVIAERHLIKAVNFGAETFEIFLLPAGRDRCERAAMERPFKGDDPITPALAAIIMIAAGHFDRALVRFSARITEQH